MDRCHRWGIRILRFFAVAVARFKVLAAGAVVVGALLVVYFVDPSRSPLFLPCPVHRATGLYCPGCGSTRALHNLLHGDLSGAMAKNPLMVVSIPLIVLLYLRPRWAYNRAVPWIAFAIIVVYGVLRNLGTYPFTLLAPH